jgi:cytidine deaminase
MTIESLFAAARAVRERAYAPYSGFQVGAAILSRNGHTYLGCNIENAAYPSGTCAEQAAIAAMVAAGENEIAAIAIAGSAPAPCFPCGACRQRIREFANGDTKVIAGGTLGAERVETTLDQLLPHAFGPEQLPGLSGLEGS